MRSVFRRSIYDTPDTSRKAKRLLLILGVFFLLVGVGFGIQYAFQATNKEKTQASKPTPTPTVDIFPTETPTPTVEPTPQLTPTGPTGKPTASPKDAATGLNRYDLTVAVKNGSGEVGGATKASEVIKTFGYRVVSIGNADNFMYEETTILIKPAKSKYLPLLQKDLATIYTISSASVALTASTSADAVVIVGK